jgi:hypothetical protein
MEYQIKSVMLKGPHSQQQRFNKSVIVAQHTLEKDIKKIRLMN